MSSYAPLVEQGQGLKVKAARLVRSFTPKMFSVLVGLIISGH
jgi:hypothetical protein